MIENIINTIRISLLKDNVNCQITYRLKDPISILKKLSRKEGNIQKIYDIIAIRIIVNNIEDCYKSLEIINSMYMINNFQIVKNYIDAPKNNGYQSIHALIREDLFNRNIEVQIRTHEMHQIAEFGTASHHEYKQEQRTQRLFEAMTNKLLFDRAYNIFIGFNWTLPDLMAYEDEVINIWQHFKSLDRTSTNFRKLI